MLSHCFTMPAHHWTALSVLLLTLHAQAQNQSDAITVTASRTSLKVSETLAQVSVIDRDSIILAGFTSLSDILQRYAGTELRATGGPGQPIGIFMRGASAQHTLVLVDGQRIGASTNGAAALENLTPDMIDRIEVVRGPMSALYGSDAIGGVVHIFTRQSNVERREANLVAGSYGTQALRAGFTVADEKTSLQIAASTGRIDAASASNRGAGIFTYHPDKDPYRRSHVELKLSHELWQGERLQISAWQSQGKTHYDAGAGSDPVNKQILSGLQLKSENRLAAYWRTQLSLGETRDDSQLSGTFAARFRTAQRQYTWHNEFDTRVGRLIAGLERREEAVSGTTSFQRSERDTNSIYLGVNQKSGDQTLSFNSRLDQESQYGDRTTGSIAWGYQLWPDELLYFSYGQGFRAPTFNDLYFPGFGNPNLRPEKSESTEFGWRVTREAFRTNFAAFASRIADLIVFDPITSLPQNTRRARITGWEYAVDTAWLGIDWRTRIARQHANDADTGLPLRGRAKLFGSIGASVQWHQNGIWQAGTDLTATGSRYDSTDASPTSRLPGMTLWSAHLRYRWDKMWVLELVGHNLANRHYETARGYDGLGRQIQIQIRYVN